MSPLLVYALLMVGCLAVVMGLDTQGDDDWFAAQMRNGLFDAEDDEAIDTPRKG